LPPDHPAPGRVPRMRARATTKGVVSWPQGHPLPVADPLHAQPGCVRGRVCGCRLGQPGCPADGAVGTLAARAHPSRRRLAHRGGAGRGGARRGRTAPRATGCASRGSPTRRATAANKRVGAPLLLVHTPGGAGSARLCAAGYAQHALVDGPSVLTSRVGDGRLVGCEGGAMGANTAACGRFGACGGCGSWTPGAARPQHAHRRPDGGARHLACTVSAGAGGPPPAHARRRRVRRMERAVAGGGGAEGGGGRHGRRGWRRGQRRRRGVVSPAGGRRVLAPPVAAACAAARQCSRRRRLRWGGWRPPSGIVAATRPPTAGLAGGEASPSPRGGGASQKKEGSLCREGGCVPAALSMVVAGWQLCTTAATTGGGHRGDDASGDIATTVARHSYSPQMWISRTRVQLIDNYSRSPKNPSLQLFQKGSKSASVGQECLKKAN